jgi:hypothetical protein
MLSSLSKIPKRAKRTLEASQQQEPVLTSHVSPVMGTRDRSEVDESKRKRRESEASRQREMAKAIKAKEGAT